MLFATEIGGNTGSRWRMRDCPRLCRELSLCAKGRSGLCGQRALEGPVTAQPVSASESLCVPSADGLVWIGRAFPVPPSSSSGSTQNSPLILIGLDKIKQHNPPPTPFFFFCFRCRQSIHVYIFVLINIY